MTLDSLCSCSKHRHGGCMSHGTTPRHTVKCWLLAHAQQHILRGRRPKRIAGSTAFVEAEAAGQQLDRLQWGYALG